MLVFSTGAFCTLALGLSASFECGEVQVLVLCLVSTCLGGALSFSRGILLLPSITPAEVDFLCRL